MVTFVVVDFPVQISRISGDLGKILGPHCGFEATLDLEKKFWEGLRFGARMSTRLWERRVYPSRNLSGLAIAVGYSLWLPLNSSILIIYVL